jgi:hypothetical protein
MKKTKTKSFRLKISLIIDLMPLIILKVSAQIDEFFLRYEIPKKSTIFGALLRERSGFCQRVISGEMHSLELKVSGYNKDHEIYYWRNFQSEIPSFDFFHNTL